MKKIFRKLLYVVTSLTLITTTSCEDYIDVNKDPNNPEISELTPDNILPGAQTSTANIFATRMNQLGNIMAVSWSGNATDFSSPFDDEFRYNLASTFYNDIWDNMYQSTSNFSHIEKHQDGKNWDYHKAIAKIMKTFYFQYLVDLYGDIPYTQIHQRADFLFPKYDDDKTIYRALVSELDKAIALINNTDKNTVKSVATTDVMMKGNMTKWIRFANTIKLRILLRQTNLNDAETTTYLAQQFANLNGAQFIGPNDDVVLNPGYINSDGKQNPFYARYGRDPQGSRTASNNLVGPTRFQAQYLQGTLAGRSFLDPRRTQLYVSRVAGSTTISGVLQGASSGRPSRLGPGILKGSDQSLPVMLAAESLFLQAEAVQRGYLAGDAKAIFESGITSSFVSLGLPATTAATYITDSANINTIGWNGSANKIEAIITQKWIANTSTNGTESWIELTRTGFPSAAPISSTASKPTRPIRLLYPDSEYAGNTANVPNQTKEDGFTSKVFWNN